jgi:hypothetical protein
MRDATPSPAASGMLYPERLAPIAGFLNDIGIPCAEGYVPDESFLPGVAVAGGTLVYDAAALGSPGDLLHEAGHIALVPARFRGLVDDDVDAVITGLIDGTATLPAGAAPATDGEIALLRQSEPVAGAWSYAAAMAIGAPAACVFWGETYRGKAEALIGQLEQGFHIGIQWLARFGYCTAPPPFGDPMEPAPFPHMRRWLAD